MKCPECSSISLKITDSRYYESGNLQGTKKRKRLCKSCGHSFHTFEICYPPDQIEKVLNALDEQLSKHKVPWTNEEDKELMAMMIKGYSRSTIAARLGRSYEAVRKRIYILGLAV